MDRSETQAAPFERRHSADDGGGLVLEEGALVALAELDAGDGSDIVGEIIGLFLGEAAARVGEIDAGLDSMELDRVLHAAHALKSSSASVGAVHFSRCCAEVERLCREGGSAEEVGLHARRAVSMYTDVQGALQSLLATR